ncbi:MAG: hypothetical protein EOM26_03405 [Alphaproteobacteria bacterium]|nr:hypothetical protein [Alphaproteobacteria bacterium]
MKRSRKVEVIEDEELLEARKNLPVFPDLNDKMKVDLAVNSKGEVWVLHTRPFPGILLWAEYDADTEAVTLCMEDGKIQELGIKVNQQVGKFLLRAKRVFTILTDGKKIEDMYLVPLLVRNV